MKSKNFLAVTLLLPFVSMPSVANAWYDYSYWQRPARLAEQRVPYAQAYYYGPAQAYYYGPLVADQYPIWGPMLCTYQGGPKSNTWACR